MTPTDFGHSAKIAATVEYDVTARPSGLRADFAARDGASLTFVDIKAIDGNRIAAALWQPVEKAAADTTMIVMIHGSGQSYHTPPQSALPPLLSTKGYASFAINTRQHGDKINTDNFFDVRRDIDAAVHVARACGYKRIVLQGHSLGNIQVQFYAATNWDADIEGVILLGPFGNLPWKTQNILVQNDVVFRKLIETSRKALADDALGDVMSVRMPYYRGGDSAMTAQHFLTYRWDKTSSADGTYWISRIPKPILLVRDQADGVVQPFEPVMLESAAKSEGSLNTSFEYVALPNDQPPSLEGHSFVGNEQPLANVVVRWLSEQHL